MATKEPKRERTLYEIASSFFAVCVIVSAVAGMVAAAVGDEGIVSLPFAICVLFLLLGVGRLYIGWVRGNEGAEEQRVAAEPERPVDPARATPARPAESVRRPRRGEH